MTDPFPVYRDAISGRVYCITKISVEAEGYDKSLVPEISKVVGMFLHILQFPVTPSKIPDLSGSNISMKLAYINEVNLVV